MRLIDADALWDKVLEHTKDGDVINRIPPDFIDNAPTVDAEPVRHGQWILDPDGIYWNLPAWICSECICKNDMLPVFINGKTINPRMFVGSNYCPDCGAKMDKTEEDAQ